MRAGTIKLRNIDTSLSDLGKCTTSIMSYTPKSSKTLVHNKSHDYHQMEGRNIYKDSLQPPRNIAIEITDQFSRKSKSSKTSTTDLCKWTPSWLVRLSPEVTDLSQKIRRQTTANRPYACNKKILRTVPNNNNHKNPLHRFCVYVYDVFCKVRAPVCC